MLHLSGGLNSCRIPSAVREMRTSSHWALVASGHTGALFLLSEDVVVVTFSWCCLDMKMGFIVGGNVLGLRNCFSASCVPFRVIEYNTNGVLEINLPRTAQE